MSIYSFIYCFFYRFWGSKVGNGRIIASAHVAFAILMHMLFLSEILRSTKIVKLGNGQYPIIRDAYWVAILIIIFLIFLIYNSNRTERLLKEYNIRYANDVLGNTLRIFFYLVVPTIVGVLLALIRHRAFV